MNVGIVANNTTSGPLLYCRVTRIQNHIAAAAHIPLDVTHVVIFHSPTTRARSQNIRTWSVRDDVRDAAMAWAQRNRRSCVVCRSDELLRATTVQYVDVRPWTKNGFWQRGVGRDLLVSTATLPTIPERTKAINQMFHDLGGDPQKTFGSATVAMAFGHHVHQILADHLAKQPSRKAEPLDHALRTQKLIDEFLDQGTKEETDAILRGGVQKIARLLIGTNSQHMTIDVTDGTAKVHITRRVSVPTEIAIDWNISQDKS